MRNPWVFLLPIAIVALYFLFRNDYWEKDLIIRSDGYAYYGYIQGTLVHHDPLNTFHDELEGRALHRSWMHEGLPGRYLPKMTMGLAYAWAPGFFVAHAAAGMLGYPQDGWSRPYQLSVGITGVLFLVLGCFFLWKLLSLRFSNVVSSLTVLTVYLATNLLQYGSVDNSMSHVYTFGLVSLFLWLSQRFVTYLKTRDLLLAGFILGWIVLIRPTNVVVGLFLPFLLYQERKQIRVLIHGRTLLAAVAACIPIIPQLIFWKLAAGEWVHYSYEQEAFYWLNPHIWEGLFSYRNGWLVYTPVMVFALLGLVIYLKVERLIGMGVALIALLHIYVTFSWWCWYYGGSLSIRPMIDIYPLLALGLAAAWAWLLSKPMWISMIGFALVGVLTWNNFLQVRYANLGVITDSTMTKEAFWATFMNPEQPKHLSVAGCYRDPDTENLRRGLPERLIYDTLFLGELADLRLDGLQLDPQKAFSNPVRVPGSQIPSGQQTLIQVRFELESDHLEENELHGVISFNSEGDSYSYQAANFHAVGVKGGRRSSVSLYVKRPVYFPDSGEMEAYFWLKGRGEAKVYSIEVEPIEVRRRPL